MVAPFLSFLRLTTMYRLMVYVLVTLVGYAIFLAAIGVLPYNPLSIGFTAIYLSIICYIANHLFARLFGATVNPESQFITALILTLLLEPLPLISSLEVFTVAAVSAMASKYIFVWRRQHLFNPAAFGVITTAILIGHSASWWGGSASMLPAVILGGLIILTKIKRFALVGTFMTIYLALFAASIYAFDASFDIRSYLVSTLLVSPLIFFSVIMLVEPQTAPSGFRRRLFYAAIIATVLVVYQRFTSVPYSLELALITGNLIGRFMQSDARVRMQLKKKNEIAANTFEFLFEPDIRIIFTPGQFLEWTLPHSSPDSRGIRRFFTIAASPTEPFIRIATRMNDKSSTFKAALNAMKPGDTATAANLDGDFILPSQTAAKLVFIAGGIGITPFYSMIKYIVDSNQKRDIVLFYSSRTEKDIAFRSVFDEAVKKIGLKIVYTITDDIPASWQGKTGFIDEKMITDEVPDFKERIVYISGPEPMVEAFEKMIAKMGLADKAIKRDFFPGYTETHQKTKL